MLSKWSRWIKICCAFIISLVLTTSTTPMAKLQLKTWHTLRHVLHLSPALLFTFSWQFLQKISNFDISLHWTKDVEKGATRHKKTMKKIHGCSEGARAGLVQQKRMLLMGSDRSRCFTVVASWGSSQMKVHHCIRPIAADFQLSSCVIVHTSANGSTIIRCPVHCFKLKTKVLFNAASNHLPGYANHSCSLHNWC